MSTQAIRSGVSTHSTADRALGRIAAEIAEGLRHGYFEFRVTCEVIGQGRRRLVLHAGKTYQFVIPVGDCERMNGVDLVRRGAGEDT
jgi:hypothetical protein